jgi:hypothetical protein
MTLGILTLSIATFRKLTFCIMAVNMTAFGKTIHNRITLRIVIFNNTWHNDTRYNYTQQHLVQ